MIELSLGRKIILHTNAKTVVVLEGYLSESTLEYIENLPFQGEVQVSRENLQIVSREPFRIFFRECQIEPLEKTLGDINDLVQAMGEDGIPSDSPRKGWVTLQIFFD